MRPTVYKDGICWIVAGNGRKLYVRERWDEAIHDADRLATYRARRQFKRDIARIARCLEMMSR